MLRKLTVRNIALIRELELDFETGLTVLTGETGAGKSLIVDALNFLLGAKAERTLISHGSEKAKVEGIFSVSDDLRNHIIDLGFDCEDGEILISRLVTVDGRSEIRINGKSATLSILKGITTALADIHGQHEHQSLLRVSTHIELLDAFGEKKIDPLKIEVAHSFKRIQECDEKIASLGGNEAERARTLDLLEYQIREIEQVNPSEQEETDLESEYFKASNAEKLANGIADALNLIDGEGENLSGIGKAGIILDELEKFGDVFSKTAERVKSAYLELDDIVNELKNFTENNAPDPKELDRIIDRREDYKRLKKKYGPTILDVSTFLNEAIVRRDQLLDSEAALARLELERAQAVADYRNSATKLTQLRKEYAKVLENNVLSELGELGMGGSSFMIQIESDYTKHSTNGSDHVEFYLSTNKGEPPKPLTKVASGGEMSRFMLAIKVIAAESDGIDTIVFDEIDTGISGKVGEAIACKLAKLSRSHQILCISHLPYIAAMADSHFLIHKESDGERTSTFVDSLSREGMLEEIGRLVGGSEISAYSLSHSAELKDWCDRYKAHLGHA